MLRRRLQKTKRSPSKGFISMACSTKTNNPLIDFRISVLPTARKHPFGGVEKHHKAATVAMRRPISLEPLGSPISMVYPLGVWMRTDVCLKAVPPVSDTGKNDTGWLPADLKRRRQS
jgi:hypothetical protein